jgi:hypothetical protein
LRARRGDERHGDADDGCKLRKPRNKGAWSGCGKGTSKHGFISSF